MYCLTERVIALRESTVNSKTLSEKVKYIRDFLYRLGELECDETTPNGIVAARALCNVIDKSPAYIMDGELIVGYNFGDNGTRFPYTIEDNDEARANLKECGFADSSIDKFFRNTDKIIFKRINAEAKTLQEKQLELEWAAVGKCICDSHSVIGYEEVLKYGFSGLLKRVEKYEAENGESDFYNGVKMVCRSAMKLGRRYEAEALTMAEAAEPKRKAELLEIAKVCAAVPENPASNFREALQSLWFAHIINTWEDNINANSLGRLDQILYPYYEKDIHSGALTKDEAFELICCLWLKLYRDYDVQQSCVGGCDANGNEAVNDLSYMMLDATEQLDFVRCLSVRFSKNTDKAFLKRALEVVGRVQKGIPFFFNDDVVIPSLMYGGIEYKDAVNYTQLGCIETVIPGKSNPHAVSGRTNLLKALEYTLNQGRSMVNESFVPGINVGKSEQFDTYEKLYEAVKRQIYYILDATCRRVVKETEAAVVNAPHPFKSLLTEGCVETNRDFNNYGAVYDFYQIMLGGVPNLADSMAVLRKFVFESGKYTLDDVVYQMKNNFPDEIIRLEFVNKAHKYGNDCDDVDMIAYDIINYSVEALKELSDKYKLNFHAQPFTYLWMLEQGRQTAATPDGRRMGEVIAYSVSPMQGRDFSGLTALLNSISKLPTKKTPGTTSAIVEVSPDLYTDKNIELLADILMTAGEKGLSNVQFNTVDADTLRDAQANPDKYNNLAVRVSGFSQKFNLLDKDLQDHIIERTKHTCL